MKKIIFIIILLFPILVFAQNKSDIIFEAEVIEIIDEREKINEDGNEIVQQNLKLLGLSDEYKNQEINYFGIGEVEVLKSNIYKQGDKVEVVASFSADGDVNFYILDYVRTNVIYFLFFLFVLFLIIVGRLKGLRSLLSLIISFFVITSYIIPQILAGAEPVIVSLIGSAVILLVIIYFTEGFNKKANIASLAIVISLFITVFLSWFFVNIAKLSGLGREEIAYLINIGNVSINFRGLLLAGIIVGTLGVLDDVIISQVATVEQLYKADKYQQKKEVFKKAYEVGVSHISSMANTLFLAYTGASLPLLILFVSGESAYSSFSQVINNEQIATEIVRTLAGSIGLIFAVPISTILAVIFLKE